MTKRYILQTPVLWYISARIEAGLTDGTYIFKPKCFMAIWNLFRPFGTFYVWTFGIFCGNLVYFVAIWYILWQFGIFCGNLVYFVASWYILWQVGIFCGNLVYFVVIRYFCGNLVYFVALWSVAGK
jgi:hypothetical protein